MAKFYTIIAIIAVSMALVAAEPPRFRQAKRSGALKQQNNRKFFARQEVAPDAAPAAAPYPAAGVTPEIPFELPTETEAPVPDQTYGPPEPTPDQTYGPPEATPDQTYGPPEPTPDQTYGPPEPTPDQTYGPPEDSSPAITEPDNTYGPPSADEQPEPAAEELPPSETNLVSENLIQPRNKFGRSRSAPLRSRSRAVRSRSARLVAAPIQKRSTVVEIIRSEPVLIYTLH